MVSVPLCPLTLTASFPRDPAYPTEIKSIGDLLRAHRLDRGLLQKEVAELVGASFASIQAWETNRNAPRINHYPGIIRFLGFDPLGEPTTFAEKLRAVRRRYGLSADALGAHLGIDSGSVSRYENGRMPYRRTLARIEPLVDALLNG